MQSMAALSPNDAAISGDQKTASGLSSVLPLGDFYEMFYDDAMTASKELELTLTGKECGQAERAPMCGVPFHAYEGYVAPLMQRATRWPSASRWRTQRRPRGW